MSDQPADPAHPVPPPSDRNPSSSNNSTPPPQLQDPTPAAGEDAARRDEPTAAAPVDGPSVWASDQTSAPAPQDAPVVTSSPAPAEQPSAWASGQTVAYPGDPHEPRVGDQFPAAVLPGAPQPTAVLPGPGFPPSGPIPVAPQTGPIPVPPPSQPLPAPYAPRKPRNKAVVWLTAAVAFFVLVAGVLGALWLVEVGDHKGTTSELQSVRDNLENAKGELKTALADKDSATAAKQRLERDAENNKSCLTSVKAMVRADNEQEFKKLADEVYINC
jgi:hypothetical protein